MPRHSFVIIVLVVCVLTACSIISTPPAATPTPQPVATATPVLTITPAILDAIETAGASSADILPHITLNANLFYSQHWMRVSQTVDIMNTSSDGWSEVVLSVPLHYEQDAFRLDSLEVKLGTDVQDGTPSFFGRETMLHIPLPRAAQPGETVQITIGYRVIFPSIEPTVWPPTGNAGWTPDLIQAGEWYPAVIPYVDGRGWLTWDYHPVGDPTIYPLTNIDLAVTTDDSEIVVASGGPDGHDGNVWKFHVTGARGIAFLASPNFRISEGMAGNIPITSYSLPQHKEQGKAAVEIAAQAVALFSKIYGPYPYSSLTVVENGFFGGMEYSEMISITDYCYETYHDTAESCLPPLVAHETAHQWWYGSVGNDQVHEPWLDESMAFYSELLYYERYYPDETDWWWEKRVDVYNPYGPVDAAIYSYEKSEYFIPSMYGQAARFLRDLRRLMGEEQFFAFLHDYYGANAGRTVTGSDFFKAVRQHYQGDLGPLMRAYFAHTDY